jgi:REP element-mobilizing transposase RayT
MGSTYHNLRFHLVFGTKERRPLISPEGHERLHAYLGGIIRNQGGVAWAVGGVEDHVHLLIGLKPTHIVADVARDLKKDPSTWGAENFTRGFGWQEGYAVFSVGAGHAEAVRAYIARQEEHHRKTSFLDEVKLLLEKHGVGYDPKYLA